MSNLQGDALIDTDNNKLYIYLRKGISNLAIEMTLIPDTGDMQFAYLNLNSKREITVEKPNENDILDMLKRLIESKT